VVLTTVGTSSPVQSQGASVPFDDVFVIYFLKKKLSATLRNKKSIASVYQLKLCISISLYKSGALADEDA
jgi:hypothetical protein